MIEFEDMPEKLIPAEGYVMVSVPQLSITEKDGLVYDPLATESIADLAVQGGVVYAVGSTDVKHHNYLWDSPLQVYPGNRVWWLPNAVKQMTVDRHSALRVIKTPNQTILCIPYKSLVMKLENGAYVGLNDYVIAEPIVDHEMSGLPTGIRHRVIGVPLPGITYRRGSKFSEVPIKVKVGDEVILRNPCRMYLETSDRVELPGRWVVFQSSYIGGVIKDGEKQAV